MTVGCLILTKPFETAKVKNMTLKKYHASVWEQRGQQSFFLIIKNSSHQGPKLLTVGILSSQSSEERKETGTGWSEGLI